MAAPMKCHNFGKMLSKFRSLPLKEIHQTFCPIRVPFQATRCLLSKSDCRPLVTYAKTVGFRQWVQGYKVLDQQLNSDMHALRNFSSAAEKITCWKCGEQLPALKERFFCHCGLVQPPNYQLTYFDLLGVKQKFDLDPTTLADNFKDLQWRLHPDKFSIKSKEEQEYSYQQSSFVNKAYQTIQKPLSRALYLLELNGMPLEEGEIQMDPEFLMHIMEQNEVLAAADTPSEMHEIGRENHSVLLDLLDQLSVAFNKHDYATAKHLVAKLQYHSNIDDKVKDWVRHHAAKG